MCLCAVRRARLVVFFGIVAQKARPCRGVSYRVSTSDLDTRHKIPLGPALFLYFANSSRLLPAAYCRDTNLTHHHGLRRHDHVDSNVPPEKLKTVNNALLTLRLSCEYG